MNEKGTKFLAEKNCSDRALFDHDVGVPVAETGAAAGR
jgi:hypothetical protein